MRKISKFTRDQGTSWDQLAEKIAAEPGVIWELVPGDDFPKGEHDKTVARLGHWARKHGMKPRLSIPDRHGDSPTVEAQFRKEEAADA